MIIEFFIDSAFDLFEYLWLKLNIDLSFFAEMIDIASSHLDTISNVLKAVLFIVPSGVIALIPFVFLLVTLRLLFALFWFLADVVNDIPFI